MTVDVIKRNIAFINADLTLSHQVTLGTVSKTKTRIGEFIKRTFKSSKYKDHDEVSHLTVGGSDYFVLTGKSRYIDTDGKNKTIEEAVFISYPHLVSFKRFLKEIHQWLESEEYADMFVQFENTTILSDKYMNLSLTANNLAAGKTITAYPTVLQDSDIFFESVGLSLNGKVDVYLTFDELTTLMELINKIDLYSSSLLLVNLKNVYGLSISSNWRDSGNYSQTKVNKSKNAIANIASKRKRVNVE